MPGEGPTAGSPRARSPTRSPLRFTSRDFRFTQHGYPDATYVYAMSTAWPEDGVARITTLGTASGVAVPGIREVTLLGDGQSLPFRRTEDALEVELPVGDRRRWAPPCASPLPIRSLGAEPAGCTTELRGSPAAEAGQRDAPDQVLLQREHQR